MKISEYIKYMGLIKICEICNWDLKEIRLLLMRKTQIRDGQISREMKNFKTIFDQKNEIYKQDPKLTEIINKLKKGE